jgi:hypothetical protein
MQRPFSVDKRDLPGHTLTRAAVGSTETRFVVPELQGPGFRPAALQKSLPAPGGGRFTAPTKCFARSDLTSFERGDTFLAELCPQVHDVLHVDDLRLLSSPLDQRAT